MGLGIGEACGSAAHMEGYPVATAQVLTSLSGQLNETRSLRSRYMNFIFRRSLNGNPVATAPVLTSLFRRSLNGNPVATAPGTDLIIRAASTESGTSLLECADCQRFGRRD